MDLNFIGNEALRKSLKMLPVNFIALEDFYNPSEFNNLDGRFEKSAEFRNGFWLKTLERFYVIEQFMKFFEVSSIFHAELDQLMFRTDQLSMEIKKLNKKGVFMPFHTQSAACASIFYCNDYQAIQDFVRFTNDVGTIENEMKLLSLWAEGTSQKVHALPSISSESKFDIFKNRMPANLLRKLDINGCVDPAQLGQWVGGADPQNEVLAIKPQTKYVERSNPDILDAAQLKKLKFSFDTSSGFLQVSNDEISNVNIYNLHFHAKLHNWLMKSDDPVRRLLFLANSDQPIMLKESRVLQFRYRSVYFFSETFHSLRKRPGKLLFIPIKLIKNFKYFIKVVRISLNIRLNRRPSSAPFLSIDTFRSLADHSYESVTTTFNLDMLTSNDVIFCQSDLLMSFNEEILENLDVEVILLLGNSDQNFTLEFTSKLNLNKVRRVFAQNLVEKIDKFEALPIGLENAWLLNNGKPITFKIQRLFKVRKKMRVMWTFSPTNLIERSGVAETLSRLEIATALPRISKFKHRFALSRYAFVASPPGNGLDCHRTWEAMYLRCIPIVKRSFMAEEFERNGLPIWVVDSYEELSQYDDEDLKLKYDELAPRFNSDLLWFSYWRELIKQ